MILSNLGAAVSSEVTKELNLRNYYLIASTTPPATLPTITRAVYIGYSVDLALQHYGYPKTLSWIDRRYLPQLDWNGLVNTAIDVSKQLDSQYILLNGLRMSGLKMGETIPSTTYVPTWGSVWGPIILQMIGAAATIGGTAWQAKITRDQLEAQYQATTGQNLGVPTQTDRDAMAVQLAKMGYTQAEISTILSKAVPITQPTSQLPSWALPVGIGALALVLLTQRKG